MTRVLLINPPSPEALGTPLLGQQYVAAALLQRGCDVRVIDAAANRFPYDINWIVAEADRFAPDIVGMGLFTRWIWHAYRLVDALRGCTSMLVAGGAHTTVRPDETLARGFDVAVIGEAEETISKLVDVVERKRTLAQVPGIRFRDDAGTIGSTPSAGFIDDLDALAQPQTAGQLYDGAWYGEGISAAAPGGMLTSRGCPARCTFCANYVTGRGFRHRSAADVVAELEDWHTATGATFFPFWDDALTANRRRLADLCRAFEDDLSFPLHWSAITRANQVTPELLRQMKSAGLIAVNFGVESGDDTVLRAIKKGVSTDQVVRALEWAKEEGLRTAANFMVGFPQETPRELENTLRFMERIAPLVDTFSTLGVLVPFPGTPLYDDHHEAYGFTDWWLEEDYSHYTAAPDIEDREAFHRYYIDDSNLALDFFKYDAATTDLIRSCLRFKAEHNLAGMGFFDDRDAA